VQNSYPASKIHTYLGTKLLPGYKNPHLGAKFIPGHRHQYPGAKFIPGFKNPYLGTKLLLGYQNSYPGAKFLPGYYNFSPLDVCEPSVLSLLIRAARTTLRTVCFHNLLVVHVSTLGKKILLEQILATF
jgi:hypothetical protein